MRTFVQSTGYVFDENGKLLCSSGYAGRDAGRNNPSMEGIKGIGPLPHGRYTGVRLYEEHPTLGNYAIQLEPDEETRKLILSYGRNPDSFFCHGDSVEHPGLASHGCIVQPRDQRQSFWESSDRIFEVVSGRAVSDCPTCRNCGTIMIPTGKCHTCPDCGETNGCS